MPLALMCTHYAADSVRHPRSFQLFFPLFTTDLNPKGLLCTISLSHIMVVAVVVVVVVIIAVVNVVLIVVVVVVVP